VTQWTRLGALTLMLTGGSALAIGGPGSFADGEGPPTEVEEIEEDYQTSPPVSPDLEDETLPPADVEELETDPYADPYGADPYADPEELETDPNADPDAFDIQQADPEELEIQQEEETESLMHDDPSIDGSSSFIQEGSADDRYAEDVEELETEEVTILRRDQTGVRTGPYVLLGGGVDGFTGGLGDEVKLGPTWGATAGVTGKRLGFELGYSGSINDARGPGGAGDGVDIVRNGGQAAVKVNLTETALHPYVMGGIGLERYSVRNGENIGFADDTSGFVPAGAGLRWNLGNTITADARVSYNFMFSDEFAPGDVGGNRLQGMLTLGGTY